MGKDGRGGHLVRVRVIRVRVRVIKVRVRVRVVRVEVGFETPGWVGVGVGFEHPGRPRVLGAPPPPPARQSATSAPGQG